MKLKGMNKYIISIALIFGIAMPIMDVVGYSMVNTSYAKPEDEEDYEDEEEGKKDESISAIDLGALKFDEDGDGIKISGSTVTGSTTKALENAVKLIKWIATAGALLLLGVFVVNLLKIGASGTNAQARAAAQQGLVWSGIATAALSIASTIFFFIQGILT